MVVDISTSSSRGGPVAFLKDVHACYAGTPPLDLNSLGEKYKCDLRRIRKKALVSGGHDMLPHLQSV